MSTPLGHSLAGAAVGLVLARGLDARHAAVVGAAVAVAPDLDFIPGLLIGDPGRFHHAASHTFIAAVIIAAAAAMSVRRARWSFLVFLAYCTHLVLDYLTVDDSQPHGIPLLWPLSARTFVAPNPPFERVLHSNISVLNLHNLEVAARELLIFLPLVVILAWWRVRCRAAAGAELR